MLKRNIVRRGLPIALFLFGCGALILSSPLHHELLGTCGTAAMGAALILFMLLTD